MYQVRAFSFPCAMKGNMSNSTKHYAEAFIVAAISLLAIAVTVAASKTKIYHLQSQIEIQAAQISSLESQLEENQKVANNSQLAQDDQNVRDAVAGIYEFDAGEGRMPQQMDLRSDGSGISCQIYDYDQMINKKAIKWSFSADGSSIWIDGHPFKPEGDDLIDSHNNRWERTH